MKDQGCPTCGSKDFGTVEIVKENHQSNWKIHCHNCKKFWFTSKSISK